MKASLLHSCKCILGEGAFWHAMRNSFMWVDIEGKSLFEYHWPQGQVQSWQFDHRLSLISMESNGNLIIAFQGGVGRFDFESGKLTRLLDLESTISNNRTNDGGVDCEGRLWVGTMDRQFKEGDGSLYCIDSNLNPFKKAKGFTIPNGLTWSIDNKIMYHIDSTLKKVQAYNFNKEKGEIHFERTVIQIPTHLGSPDGMCIDEEGMLWIAHWDGFGVYRWNPKDGELLDKIEVPVPQVSSCAFGGENLDQLLITTARENFTPEQEKKYPESGSVFVARTTVKGVRKNLFGV